MTLRIITSVFYDGEMYKSGDEARLAGKSLPAESLRRLENAGAISGFTGAATRAEGTPAIKLGRRKPSHLRELEPVDDERHGIDLPLSKLATFLQGVSDLNKLHAWMEEDARDSARRHYLDRIGVVESTLKASAERRAARDSNEPRIPEPMPSPMLGEPELEYPETTEAEEA